MQFLKIEKFAVLTIILSMADHPAVTEDRVRRFI